MTCSAALLAAAITKIIGGTLMEENERRVNGFPGLRSCSHAGANRPQQECGKMRMIRRLRIRFALGSPRFGAAD
jgi:hypothetical protein